MNGVSQYAKSAITRIQMVLIIAVIVIAGVGGGAAYYLTMPEPATVITIGAVEPLTGSAGEFGTNGKRGMEICLDEWNHEVEIDGVTYEIRIIYYDHRADPAEAVAVTKKAMVDDGVCILLTDGVSSTVMATERFAKEYECPMLTNEAEMDDITRQNNTWFFRSIGTTSMYADMIAPKIINIIHPKSVSFLLENNDFGRISSTIYADAFEEVGIEVLSTDFFEMGSTDYMSVLLKIRDLGPDLFLFFGNTNEFAMCLKQAIELGMKEQMEIFANGDAASPDLFLELVGKEDAEGIYTYDFLVGPTEDLDWLREKASEKYGVPIHFCMPFEYDVLDIALKAIKGAGSWSSLADHRQKIRDYLKTHTFDARFGGIVEFGDFDGYMNQGTSSYPFDMWINGVLTRIE